jgi:hypothetical protein
VGWNVNRLIINVNVARHFGRSHCTGLTKMPEALRLKRRFLTPVLPSPTTGRGLLTEPYCLRRQLFRGDDIFERIRVEAVETLAAAFRLRIHQEAELRPFRARQFQIMRDIIG